MQLDTATLTIGSGFVAFVCGSLLAAAGWHYRIPLTLGAWGLATIATAGGMASFALDYQQDLGHALILVAGGLSWFSIARFSNRRVSPLAISTVALIAAATAAGLVEQILTPQPTLLIAALLLLGAASDLWRLRSEELPALKFLLGFVVAHGLFLLAGGVMTLVTVAEGPIPAFDAFTLLNLEVMTYTIGSSLAYVFVVKEHQIHEGKMAANKDWLTGLLNRGGFVEAARAALADASKKRLLVAGIMFDLDRFKTINDTLGHAVGDAVLRCFAVVISRTLRQGDIAGRIGGDEFAVLIAHSEPKEAFVIAERIREEFSRHCQWIDGRLVKATVSGGVCETRDELSVDGLFAEADKALYAAKFKGRNTVQQPRDLPPPQDKTTAPASWPMADATEALQKPQQ